MRTLPQPDQLSWFGFRWSIAEYLSEPDCFFLIAEKGETVDAFASRNLFDVAAGHDNSPALPD
jgi:hypothetical protein